jgi:SOS-response transcriptional repressor LexA
MNAETNLQREYVGAGDHVMRWRGESLLPAIRPGDALVVLKTEHAETGDLVVAELEDRSTTVRYFEAGVKVLGVVTGVMRRIDVV